LPYLKSRIFNEEDKTFIDAEVRKLLKKGVIEISHSPWRAQVLVARDERHKPRMIVDYSQTINRYTLLDAYSLPNIEEQISTIAKATVFSTLDLKSAYYQIPLHPDDRPHTAFEAGGKLYQYTRSALKTVSVEIGLQVRLLSSWAKHLTGLPLPLSG